MDSTRRNCIFMAQCIHIVQEHLGVTEDYIWKHILVVEKDVEVVKIPQGFLKWLISFTITIIITVLKLLVPEN